MTRGVAIAPALLLLGGCSLLFADSSYRDEGATDAGGDRDAGAAVEDGGAVEDAGPPDAGTASCAESGCDAGQRCDRNDACVPCDADEDGFVSDDPVCDAQAGGAARDCDDDAATVFPGAPAICGDGRTNACAGTGLTVPPALTAAEGGLLPPVQVLDVPEGYVEGIGLAVVTGSGGEPRPLVAVGIDGQPDRVALPSQVRLYEPDLTLRGRLDFEIDDPDVAIFAVGARSDGEGGAVVAGFRYGVMPGDRVYRITVPSGTDELSTLGPRLDGASGSCALTDGSFAISNFPFAYLTVSTGGYIGAYNRRSESNPYTVVDPGGSFACNRQNEFFSGDLMVAGDAALFHFRDDAETNPLMSIWNVEANRVDTFRADTPLLFSARGDFARIGDVPGRDLERHVLFLPGFDGPTAIPIDCSTGAFPTCGRAAGGVPIEVLSPEVYVSESPGLLAVSFPRVRRVTGSLSALAWLEDRNVGAAAPATRVAEVVLHIGDQAGVIDRPGGSLPEGVPLLRYEFDDTSASFRVPRTIEIEVARDAATGDVTVYALGAFNERTEESFIRPTNGEVVLGGARFCASL